MRNLSAKFLAEVHTLEGPFMRFFSKTVSLLLAVFILASTLAGCSQDEMSVLSSMLKSNTITSMESKTELRVKAELSGLPEDEAQKAALAIQMLNQSTFHFDQKVVRNFEKGIMKAQLDGKINLGGLPVDMGVWVDMDYSAEKPVFREVVALPSLLKMSLPKDIRNKEYFVIDLGQSGAKLPESGADMKMVMDLSRQIQSKATDLITAYAKQFKPGFTLVKAVGPRTIHGVSYPAYQLKLDDAAFKKLIKYVVNDYATNKDTFNLVKDYVLSLVKISEAIDPKSADEAEKVEKAFADMSAGLPVFAEEFNKFMEAVKDVTVLGEKGITITYVINDKGYIVNEEGVIDLALDANSIKSAIAALDKSADVTGIPPVVAKLEISFTTDITKINETVEIVLPELTEQNSLNLLELGNSFPFPAAPDEDAETGLTVYVNDAAVPFLAAPVTVNDRILVPAGELFDSIGGEVLWNPQTQSVTALVNDESVVEFVIGSKEAWVDGEAYTLDVPAQWINGRAYIPLRFLMESLGGDMEWDEKTTSAYIYY